MLHDERHRKYHATRRIFASREMRMSHARTHKPQAWSAYCLGSCVGTANYWMNRAQPYVGFCFPFRLPFTSNTGRYWNKSANGTERRQSQGTVQFRDCAADELSNYNNNQARRCRQAPILWTRSEFSSSCGLVLSGFEPRKSISRSFLIDKLPLLSNQRLTGLHLLTTKTFRALRPKFHRYVMGPPLI